jgi:hypothetical protein
MEAFLGEILECFAFRKFSVFPIQPFKISINYIELQTLFIIRDEQKNFSNTKYRIKHQRKKKSFSLFHEFEF